MFALTQLKSFWFRFFQKANRFSGRRPEAHSAECEILHRSKNAGEGEFLCEAKEEGEPSSGVLPYVLKIENGKLACEHSALGHYNINRHSFAFSFGCVSAKEKASQKENAVFLCRFLKKAPQKLFLIALCEMYTVPDRFG